MPGRSARRQSARTRLQATRPAPSAFVVRVSTTLHRAEMAKLQRRAAERNLSVSALVRSILRGAPTVLSYPNDILNWEAPR